MNQFQLNNCVELYTELLACFVYSVPFISNSFQCVCSGILVGSGMQKIAALSNLVSYYCIGLPVGVALMFAAKLRILGTALFFLLLRYMSAYKVRNVR